MTPARGRDAQKPDPGRGTRRHRRVDAAATDGIPESARTDRIGDVAADREADGEDAEQRGEQWWRAQRPPHWE